jgi:hypothetical protein
MKQGDAYLSVLRFYDSRLWTCLISHRPQQISHALHHVFAVLAEVVHEDLIQSLLPILSHDTISIFLEGHEGWFGRVELHDFEAWRRELQSETNQVG